MTELANSRRGAVVVAAFLILQIVLFALSMDAFMEMSVFCTAPTSSPWSLPFGFLHLSFVGLFLLGIVSLRVTELRLRYVALIAIALLLLAVQILLVWKGVLRCDAF